MSKQCETNYVRIIQRSSQYVNICAVHLTVSVTVAITTVIRPTTHLQVAESDAFMLPLSINDTLCSQRFYRPLWRATFIPAVQRAAWPRRRFHTTAPKIGHFRRRLFSFLVSLLGVQSTEISVSVRSHIKEHASLRPNLTNFSVRVTRGSLLLWWQCNALSTSGLWMT